LLAVLDHAAAKGINSASGGALAYVPGSGLVSAADADQLPGVLNRYTGLAAPAPGLLVGNRWRGERSVIGEHTRSSHRCDPWLTR
jgi:hypothetical protein